MTRHLSKLFDMLWYASAGLFLGLNAGTILGVVEAFDSSRKIDATPGLMPYADERFAETANEVVAGFMAQNIFKNNGSVALVLIGIALLTRIGYPVLIKLTRSAATGSLTLSRLRFLAVIISCALMLVGAKNMLQMNEDWPALYEIEAEQAVLDERRAAFDTAHKTSERVVGGAWFVGAFALIVSPWCRRIADEPTQTETSSVS